MTSENLPPILPAGTAVVTLIDVGPITGTAHHRINTPGTIILAPEQPNLRYRVQFFDGTEVQLLRNELQVLSKFQAGALSEADNPFADYDFSQFVIYRCVIGSRAYGLDRETSDIDRRGVYLPAASLQWSIYSLPGQLENDATQECYWELEKYIKLALKANPNVLETLYSPIVEHAEPIARELLDSRQSFLSKLVFQTFNGYAMSQFRKMEQDICNHGEVKWKHAMHLIRLLLSGIQVLRDGFLQVQVGEHREALLAIRDGAIGWDQLDRWRLSLHAEFEQSARCTQLPDRPDYQKANTLLVRARRMMADREKDNT